MTGNGFCHGRFVRGIPGHPSQGRVIDFQSLGMAREGGYLMPVGKHAAHGKCANGSGRAKDDDFHFALLFRCSRRLT